MPNADTAYQAVRRVASDQARLVEADGTLASATGFQYIARPTHRMDQLLLKRVICFGAQTPDMDIHDVRITLEVDVPDHLGDQRARQYFPLAPRKQTKQRKFLGSEAEAPTVAGGAMREEIDFKVRNDLEIRKHYLQGRFGAVPFVGSLDHVLEGQGQAG